MKDSGAMQLRKFVAPEIVFGAGARALAAQYATNFGARKVLVVTDPGVQAAGWTGRLTADLDEALVPYAVYSDVTSNPRAEEMMAGAEFYRQQGCDVVIAIGGGSPIDCAKGIAIVVANRRPILEFEGVDQVDVALPPVICIPTTGGTSADVSQFAVMTDQQERVKKVIISKAVVPDVSLVDPTTLTTMDPLLTACTGLDALVHAIEAFVSTAGSPITDLHALHAISLIWDNLLRTVRDPANVELRTQVMLGSLEAGLAFSNASLGAVHAMSHSLGGLLDLPHGECNALLLDHVVAFNFAAAVDRYRRIGEAMGMDLDRMTADEARRAVLEAVRRIRADAGVIAGLRHRGVHRTDIPELARHAVNDPCMVTNPRPPGQRDVEVVYEEAL